MAPQGHQTGHSSAKGTFDETKIETTGYES